MKIIRKINNNAVICLDSLGNELVAIGTGIGFPKVPYVLEDLSKIQRTYFDVNPIYLNLLDEIPQEIFDVATKIVNLYREKVNIASSNVVFTLADHINFAIERQRKNIVIEAPLEYDIQQLYEREYEIGIKALKIIYSDLGIKFSRKEAVNIAMHFLNAGVRKKAYFYERMDWLLNDIVELIGKHFEIYIDKSSINYSRFVSHLQYLLKRNQQNKPISSENLKLFQTITTEYPETYKAVVKIKNYLKEEMELSLNDEELVYLILHVNKLCAR